MKLSRLILLVTPAVLMSAAAPLFAETATIISPEQAPAPIVKPRNDRIAEQERQRTASERKRANEERRRREAAEQAAARLKTDAVQSERQRQRAASESRRAEEERRRREAAEQAIARVKSDAANESERQRQRAQEERKRAEAERRRREAAEQAVARLKTGAAGEAERQRHSAAQERKRADEERRRREAAEQAVARLKSDAAAETERQRSAAEQERKRADEERGRREAAEQAVARLKSEVAESERQREAAATSPKPFPMAVSRGEEPRSSAPAREWRNPEMQAHEAAGRSVESTAPEAGRLDTIFPGAELRRDCDVCPRVVAIPPVPVIVATAQIGEAWTGIDVRRASPRMHTWLAVSKFETTFAEWDRCVAEGGCRGYTPKDDGRGRGPRPVFNVNYADAEAYIRWLNARAGYKPIDPRRYRMLTEQEWEYAARAGSRTRFFWGDDPGYTEACAFANVPDSSLRASSTRYALPDGYLFRCADQSPFASWVGRYRPNAWGLHDMIGNVSEMVFTPFSASYIIVRGGSWLSERESHQSAARAYTRSRDAREYTIGFRVVREVTVLNE